MTRDVTLTRQREERHRDVEARLTAQPPWLSGHPEHNFIFGAVCVGDGDWHFGHAEQSDVESQLVHGAPVVDAVAIGKPVFGFV